jgi:hypothetical protein
VTRGAAAKRPFPVGDVLSLRLPSQTNNEDRIDSLFHNHSLSIGIMVDEPRTCVQTRLRTFPAHQSDVIVTGPRIDPS